ncbi:MAG TPA: T9SS type A sorting domain-containing protein, partial [Ignavibacteria bacterium]|nr:T9SS type A sorting domain-containing protein [Ignavibacteria bacterium]
PNIYWGTSLTSIMRSTDGGVSYTENDTPGGGIYIFSVHINDAGTGFAAGTGMSKTTDGGVTFQSQTVPGGGNIDAIESFINAFWYIRGTKVYLSSNNGISFVETYTAPQSMFHMDMPNTVIGLMQGWAVGIAGNIYHMDCITVGLTNISNEVPEKFSLNQNYPNPFNPTTKIGFEVPKNSDVRIVIYDISGKVVGEYDEGNINAGKYEYEFNGENLTSGVYFYRLEVDGFTAVRKMVLMK